MKLQELKVDHAQKGSFRHLKGGAWVAASSFVGMSRSPSYPFYRNLTFGCRIMKLES
jgi:hypothetical protein